jgi:hypothetical protein
VLAPAVQLDVLDVAQARVREHGVEEQARQARAVLEPALTRPPRDAVQAQQIRRPAGVDRCDPHGQPTANSTGTGAGRMPAA